MSGLFAEENPNSLFFSRSDPEQPLGTFFAQPFLLDEALWPTVEHYYQALKFTDPAVQESIRQAATPDKARKMGRSRLRRIRKDWAQIKPTVMTRALYIRCKTHPEAMAALLGSGAQELIENSSYDYFWGCGRDRRGHNTYGKLLMNVRQKLLEEKAGA